MNLLDRFSSHLKEVLARGIQLAAELKNPTVEPIHLLFTLANQKGSVAAEIINRSKISLQTLEQSVLSLPTIKAAAPAGPPGGVAEQVLTPFSPAAKAILEKSMLIAQANQHNYLGTEHLLAALIDLKDNLINDVLKVNGVNLTELGAQIEAVLNNATQFPQITEVAEVIERLQDSFGEPLTPGPIAPPKTQKKSKANKDLALDFFATNLTSPSAQTNIDPVIGREAEIERVIQILCRRTKNNPLLLGDPGVGKTAIVEGLAKKIIQGKAPDLLLNKKIYSLDMGLLIAGTIYRGEFEARLKQVVEEIINNPQIILFIDEIHNIVGAGSNQGTLDAANLLKPALSRGQIRCIGATTQAEYKKFIEADAALERRFQPIFAKEPSLEETIQILDGIKNNYEVYHNITILPEATIAAAKLADRYIANKFMPDKAIDLLDETAAAKRLIAKTSPADNKLWRLEQQLEKTIQAKEDAARGNKFNEAVELKKAEDNLKAEIKQITASRKTKKLKPVGIVNAEDVAQTVAKIIGTPPSELIFNSQTELTKLEAKLSARVIGQPEVISEVSALIRKAQLGLSHPDRPLASLLFIGESGVGKTELAKTLAQVLYKDKEALIKLDMSEFNESFSLSKLLGSPAGYIGYKEHNQFTDKIKINPYSVILFDEIDKAHKDVTKILLQILESGVITDSTGKQISLKHAIIILTTSLGAEAAKRGLVGFSNSTIKTEEQKKLLVEKLKEYFSPELINRLDQICFFKPLSPIDLAKTAELELAHLNEQLSSYHTTVTSSPNVLNWVVKKTNGENQGGAREVRRFIRRQVEELLAELILNHNLKPYYQLTVNKEKLAVK